MTANITAIHGQLASQLVPAPRLFPLAESNAAFFTGVGVKVGVSATMGSFKNSAVIGAVAGSSRFNGIGASNVLSGLSKDALGIGSLGVLAGRNSTSFTKLFGGAAGGGFFAQGFKRDETLGFAQSIFTSEMKNPAVIDAVAGSFRFNGVGSSNVLGGLSKDALGIGSLGVLAGRDSASFKKLLGDATGFFSKADPLGGGFFAQGIKRDEFGFAQGALTSEMKKLMEPITTSLASVITAGATARLSAVRPTVWLGSELTRSKAADRSVDAWLLQVRQDLRQKHAGMWDAIVSSSDPVLHAATSAVELLLRLLRVSSVSEEDVRAWALDSQFEAVALDHRHGDARVTWTGRALLAAHRAGYDDVGQSLLVTLVQSARILQEMKHNSHRYEVRDVEPHLERVDEFLSMLAWRL